MLTWHAIECCRHLGNEKRFAILETLAAAGDDGLSISQLARKMTLSRGVVRRHMTHLNTVGLARMQRDGRRVVCTANATRLRDLTRHLATSFGVDVAGAFDETDASLAEATPLPDSTPLFSSLRDRLEAFDAPKPVAARSGMGQSRPRRLADALSEAGTDDPFSKKR